MSLLALAAETIFTPLEIIEEGVVVIEERRIRSVGSRRETAIPAQARFLDLGHRILAPGFVDVHIHGAAGHDVMEATPEALQAVADFLARHGTTCFVPTTLTAPLPALLQSLQALGDVVRSWRNDMDSGGQPLAEPIGIHLEGPFLSAERRGVHPREHLQRPSVALFRQFLEAVGGTLRILTLAPELESARELQTDAVQNGVRVALGHSNATYEEAQRAIAAGARHAVHTFNAMRPFAHRDPGILGAVLTDDRIMAEVIADGVHVSTPALRLLVRAKGISNVLLATDGISATGENPGRYRLGEMEVSLQADPQTATLVCRSSDGKLAGSVLTLNQAVRNMVALTGISLCEAVTMATWNPARLLRLEGQKGWLRPGADADLVILEPDGTVAGTMTRGVGNFV